MYVATACANLVSDEVSALVDRVNQLPSQPSDRLLSVLVNETSEHDLVFLFGTGRGRLGRHPVGRRGGTVKPEGGSQRGSPCN